MEVHELVDVDLRERARRRLPLPPRGDREPRDDSNLTQAWVLRADRTNDAEITEYFASTFGFRVVFAVDNFAN